MAERDITVRVKAEIGAYKAGMEEAAKAARKVSDETEAAGKKAGAAGKAMDASGKAAQGASRGIDSMGSSSDKAGSSSEKMGRSSQETAKTTAQLAAEAQNAAKSLGLQYDASGRLADAQGKVLSSSQASAHGVQAFSESVYLNNFQMEKSGDTATKTASRWENLSSSITKNEQNLKTAGAGLTAFGAVVTGIGAAALHTGMQYNTLQQTTRAALTTITGSAAEANAQMDQLDAFAKNSPFAKDVFIRAQQQLLGFGMEATRVIPTLDAIQDAVAATGGSSQDILEIANVLAKVQGTGKITAETLNELGIRGVDAATIIGEQMGQTGDEIRAGITKGTVGADSALQALTDGMKTRFDGAAAGVKETFAGAIDRVKAAWRDLSAEMASPLVSQSGGGLAVDGLNALADAMRKFQSLPSGVKNSIALVGGLAGAAALAGGGLMLLLPRLRDTISAGRDLAKDFPRAAGAVKGIGTAAGIAAIGVGALSAAIAVHNSGLKEAKGAGHYALAIKKIGEEAGTVDDIFKNLDFGQSTAFEDRIHGIGDALKELNRGGLDHFGADMGARNHIAILRENVEGLDSALAESVASGNAEAAAKAWDQITAAARDQDVSMEKLQSLFPAYVDALKASEAASDGAAEGARKTSGALNELQEAAGPTADKIKDLFDQLFGLGQASRSVIETQDGLTGAINKLQESVKTNGKVFEGNSKKAMENRAALMSVADGMESVLQAQVNAGASAGEMQQTIKGTYDAMMEATGGADEYVRKLLSIPPEVSVDIWASDTAFELVKKTAEQIEQLPNSVDFAIAVSENGTVGQVQELINGVTGKTEYVFVTDDGSSQTVQQAIVNINGKDVPVFVTDDGTVVGTQGQINSIKGKDVTVKAVADTSSAENALSALARPRSTVLEIKQKMIAPTPSSMQSLMGHATGGRAPGLAGGGRVPETGLGTDMVMGINKHGIPHVRVDDREWVVNRRSSDKHDELLSMINRDDPRVDMMKQLVGLAGGGRVGAAEKRVQSLQRAYSRISGDKANRARKLAAKDQLDAAKAELKAIKENAKASEKRAKEAKKAAEQRAKEARERANRLGESRRDLRVDLRRGTITDAFTSGSGLSQVDKLLEVSRNSDYSMSKRKRAARDAAGLEKALASLTKRSEGLEKALASAKDKADELRAVRDAVAGDLRGEFSLSGMLSDTRKDLGSNPFTAGSIASRANRVAARIRAFAGRLDRLRKLGYGETIIQEIAALGTEDGMLAADALISASKSERNEVIKAYARLDRASNQAGQYVTESMYKGGLDAADGLVRGLESKSKHVENAFYKLGKSAEKSFKRSLGIKSPSRVMMQAGVHVGEGAELGILSKVGDVSKAAERLMAPPALTVPPSPEVARYAQAQAAAPAISTEAIAAAVQAGMAGWQPMVQIDGRKFYGTMQQVTQQYGKRR